MADLCRLYGFLNTLILFCTGSVFFYERYLRAFSAENFEIFTVSLKLKDGSLPATQRIVVESNIDDSESKLDFLIPLKKLMLFHRARNNCSP